MRDVAEYTGTFHFGKKTDIIVDINYSALPQYSSPENGFNEKIVFYREQNASKVQQGGSGSPARNCGFPCTLGEEGTCLASESGGTTEKWHCNGCVGRAAESVVKESDSTFTVDFDPLYDTRDFLLTSSKGRQYENWFYDMGYYLDGKITLSLALEAMNIYNAYLTQMIDDLLNNSSSSQVWYTNVERDKLLNFMNQIALLNSDPTFLSIVQSIKNDIIHYANKPIAYIINDFS